MNTRTPAYRWRFGNWNCPSNWYVNAVLCCWHPWCHYDVIFPHQRRTHSVLTVASCSNTSCQREWCVATPFFSPAPQRKLKTLWRWDREKHWHSTCNSTAWWIRCIVIKLVHVLCCTFSGLACISRWFTTFSASTTIWWFFYKPLPLISGWANEDCLEVSEFAKSSGDTLWSCMYIVHRYTHKLMPHLIMQWVICMCTVYVYIIMGIWQMWNYVDVNFHQLLFFWLD